MPFSSFRPSSEMCWSVLVLVTLPAWAVKADVLRFPALNFQETNFGKADYCGLGIFLVLYRIRNNIHRQPWKSLFQLQHFCNFSSVLLGILLITARQILYFPLISMFCKMGKTFGVVVHFCVSNC